MTWDKFMLMDGAELRSVAEERLGAGVVGGGAATPAAADA
jgi:hypothetical protein